MMGVHSRTFICHIQHGLIYWWLSTGLWWFHCKYSISHEICTRFLLCCGYTLTDFPISIRLASLALWQSNDCPSASKATLMNMDKYFMWIHYERLHNHNKAKHNKTVCIFLGIYCTLELPHPCPEPLINVVIVNFIHWLLSKFNSLWPSDAMCRHTSSS